MLNVAHGAYVGTGRKFGRRPLRLVAGNAYQQATVLMSVTGPSTAMETQQDTAQVVEHEQRAQEWSNVQIRLFHDRASQIMKVWRCSRSVIFN